MISSLRNSQTSIKIAQNTVYQLVGKVVSMSVTILVTILITRAYSRTGYGEFNIMQAFPALFFIIVDFGINAIATRELSQNWENAQKYLGNIIILRILMSLGLMALLALIVNFLPYSQSLIFGLYLSSFLILTQALFATTNIIFQTKLKYNYSALGIIAGSLVILIFAGLFTYLKLPIYIVNFSYVLGGLVTVLVNIFFITRMGININVEVDSKLWKYLFVQAFPIGLMLVFSQVNFKSDAILLSLLPLPENSPYSNTEAVAIYGLAFKIFEVLLVLPTFFMNAVYPVYVRHLSESSTRLKDTFLKTFSFLFGTGLLVGLFGIIFAPLAVRILGGAEFISSVPVLRILLGGIVIFYLSQPLAWLLVTLNKQIYLPFIYFVSAVFNVGANLIFIPKYSFIASSVITWISEFIILVLLAYFAVRAWRREYAVSQA